MASEITYAEVKFKNASPAAVVEAPPEMKKHEHHPQKYPPWLPWLISLLLLLTCIALVVVLLGKVTKENMIPAPGELGSLQSPSLLLLTFVAFTSVFSPCTGQSWMCCPKGWKRFQNSCYFLSLDKKTWAESEQNCTGMGSHLVVINSKEEQVFLSEQIKQASRGVNFYIGLRAEVMHQWQWVDKTPYN
ncbi:CLC4D protein, partial [Piprites chloris]|nr:CLC4D protein [Piprites chloris]